MNYDCWLAGLLACWLAGLLACWLAENTIGEIKPVNKNKNRWHFLFLKVTILSP
jgi:hypothetical protein